MNYSNIAHLKKAGFLGFHSIGELMKDCSEIPAIKGLYLVVKNDKVVPAYLEIGTGGYFKNRNPNVAIKQLQQNWVDDTIVLYIGKAGGSSSNATLKSRLKQYLRFGQGQKIGHWGGRFIWQLSTSPDLTVCWKPLPEEDPRVEERKLIAEFTAQFGKRPFANLAN